MISICETVRLQLLRKAIYSILASILHIFQKKISYRASYLLVQYTVFLYFALNLERFFESQKM